MALKSGLAAQFGMAAESTPGTPVTVTRFVPFIGETIKRVDSRLESASIIAGRRVMTSDQWNGGPTAIDGDFHFELMNRNLGQLYKQMFGSLVTTGSGPYTHTATPGDLSGVSFTAQIGTPDIGGTVDPFTLAGAKVKSWQLDCQEGQIATLDVSVVAMNEILVRTVADGVTTNASAAITSATAAWTADDVGKPISGTGIPAATTILSVQSATNATLSANATASGTSITFTIGIALATASYTAGIKPLKFNHGSVSIAGSTVKVKGLTLKGDNGLKDDRRFIGQKTIDEPLETSLRVYDGNLDVEFTDYTQYRRYLNASEVALVIAFSNGTDSVTITLNIRFDGATPDVSGPDIVMQTLDFKAVASGADSTAISWVAINSDSAA